MTFFILTLLHTVRKIGTYVFFLFFLFAIYTDLFILIERIWIEVYARANHPIKAIMNEMVHTDIADISDDSTKFCVSWVSCRLKIFVNSRNHHTIQYVIDNGVPGFTRKICFSNFNPAGIERSFDINPTFTTYK